MTAIRSRTGITATEMTGGAVRGNVPLSPDWAVDENPAHPYMRRMMIFARIPLLRCRSAAGNRF